MVDESVKHYDASKLAQELVEKLRATANEEGVGLATDSYFRIGNEEKTSDAEESLLLYIARLEKRIEWLESGDEEEE